MATVDEAIDALTQLGFPRQQLNERSGLVLLALLDLTPDKPWSEATAPLRGITPMMEHMAEHYGKRYAPNSRETVRRQTVHQFLQGGLILQNPDQPDRPVNSGKTTYQISSFALDLLRAYGQQDWVLALRRYQLRVEALKERWEKKRQLQRIPVVLPDGADITLSPGGQNVLIAALVKDFCPMFTPGGRVLYIGDADEKFAVYDRKGLEALGVVIEEHGKMPDLVVHYADRDWLVLIEAVTSHGPVDAKRHEELQTLFAGSTAGLVFVTSFLDRRTLAKYVGDISWETEVWVAESPTHLIHFNGDRFLGPYE
ncbi:BsuBI/PstI family type II restriction endonuclease [Rhabdothermincola sediminis]|uniref:BsuBI/PstI family type II restriction endonuclease n=1 Tax=Rhabdothermincola sediminis TaxID=2751370 RepID=UPI001AA085B8|nr:BsuBI/PstI family type II restriction endonuclease [Rhabdothermincola sediminis]